MNEKLLFCNKHINSTITHICISENCFTPLCGKCIKTHNTFHKLENDFSELETIEDLKEICTLKLHNQIKETNQSLKSNFYNNKSSIRNKLSDFETQIKGSINEIINDFFQNFKEVLYNGHNNMNQLNTLENELNKFLSELKNKALQMENSLSIDLMKEILRVDYNVEFRNLHKNERNSSNQFYFDKNRLETFYFDFKNLLERLFHNHNSFQKSENKFQTPTKKIEFSIPQTFELNKGYTPLKYMNYTQERNNSIDIQSQKLVNTTKGKQKTKDFTIEINNYFQNSNQKKFLHFFQSKSKNLHLFELHSQNPFDVSYHPLELSINFLLPRWHKSIITPSSQIFLLGGVSIDKKAIKLKDVYSFSFESNSLLNKCPMLIARSCFGLVWFRNFLYVIGGNIDESQTTSKCEKYNIEEDSWNQICNLNIPASNFGVCSFNDSVIYKFGGKIEDNFLNKTIEKYNPNINKWIIVNFHFEDLEKERSFKLLSSSGCCQINDSQILVFGGVEEEFNRKSNQSFLFEIKEKRERFDHIIRKIDENNVCYAEGFWETNPIVYRGHLYALQNFSNEFDKRITFLDKKKLLIFNGIYWKCLN